MLDLRIALFSWQSKILHCKHGLQTLEIIYQYLKLYWVKLVKLLIFRSKDNGNILGRNSYRTKTERIFLGQKMWLKLNPKFENVKTTDFFYDTFYKVGKPNHITNIILCCAQYYKYLPRLLYFAIYFTNVQFRCNNCTIWQTRKFFNVVQTRCTIASLLLTLKYTPLP